MTGALLEQNFLANATPVVVLGLAITAFLLSRRSFLWREAYRRLRRNKLAMAAVVVVSLFSAVAFFDSVTWQSSPDEDPTSIVQRVFSREDERTYSAPLATMTSGEPVNHRLQERHLMGTDGIGQDVFFNVLRGTRTTFIIAGLSCVIALFLALPLGLIAGYFGAIVDDAIQYLYTVFGSIPDILLIIAMVLMLGRELVWICVALAATSWINLCRLVRGETLKHRDREYVRAAQALGVSNFRILFKHILPNLLPAVIISTTLLFSSLALYETILVYLGVGVKSNVGSWGNMIDASRDELTRDPPVWWNLVFGTGALLLLVLSLNVLADALRDAIDPRLRTE